MINHWICFPKKKVVQEKLLLYIKAEFQHRVGLKL
jgi:hypothetical protein